LSFSVVDVVMVVMVVVVVVVVEYQKKDDVRTR